MLLLLFFLARVEVVIGSSLPQGVTLWLKAEDLDGSNGSSVTYWGDASGHGRGLNSTQNKQPMLLRNYINGRNTVYFVGGTFLQGVEFLDNPPYSPLFSNSGATIITVIHDIQDITSRRYFGGQGTWRGRGLELTDVRSTVKLDGYSGKLYGGSVITWAHNNSQSQPTEFVVAMRVSLDNRTNDMFFCGSKVASGISITGLNKTKIGPNPFTVGASAKVNGRDSNNRYLNAMVPEVIVYNRSLDDSEMATVNSYLKTKYSVCLTSSPSVSPTASPISAPSNAPSISPNTISPSSSLSPTSSLPQGMSLWLKADDLDGSNGSSVTYWGDASGYGRRLNASLKKPILLRNVINGHNTIHFPNGTLLQGLEFKDNPPYSPFYSSSGATMIAVVHNVQSNGVRAWFGGEGTWNSKGVEINDIRSYYRMNLYSGVGYGGSNLAWSTNGTVWEAFIFAVRISLNSRMQDLFFCGSKVSSGTSLSALNRTTFGPNYFTIGGRASSTTNAFRTHYLKSSVPEVIMYNRSLDDSEMATVHSYLKTKYSVCLTSSPSVSPTASPTSAPSNAPSFGPSVSPSSSPSIAPTESPTIAPSNAPSFCPSISPSSSPTSSPTSSPSSAPSSKPTISPSIAPTDTPTSGPSASPTKEPTLCPSCAPSNSPSNSPSNAPTTSPLSHTPTISPSVSPTKAPSSGPSAPPTNIPSLSPSCEPSVTPSSSPSLSPNTDSPITFAPITYSESPSTAPSVSPSVSPTKLPSGSPSNTPTSAPTSEPSISPTKTPSFSPSSAPSMTPSCFPSMSPVSSSPSTFAPSSASPLTNSPLTLTPSTMSPSSNAPSPTTPVAYSARFSNTLAAITMVFSSNTNQPPCSSLFKPATLSLLGKGYRCQWRSQKQLDLYLGEAPMISPNQHLNVVGGVLSDPTSSQFSGAHSVVVSQPLSPPLLTAFIEGPQSVGICGDVRIAVASLTGSAGRQVSFQWSYTTSGFNANKPAVDAYLSSQSALGNSFITLNALNFSSGDHNISVIATNFLGQSIALSHSFTKDSAALLPTVQMPTQLLAQVFADKDWILRPVVEAPSCSNGASAATNTKTIAQWSWLQPGDQRVSSSAKEYATKIVSPPDSLVSAGLPQGIKLIIRKGALSFGSMYGLNLHVATFDPSGNILGDLNITQIIAVTSSAPLSIAIEGGSLQQYPVLSSSAYVISITATPKNDPVNTSHPLRYTWGLRKSGTTVAPPLISLSSTGTNTININTSILQGDATYELIANATGVSSSLTDSEPRVASASHQFQTVSTAIPIVSSSLATHDVAIVNGAYKVKPNARVVLNATVTEIDTTPQSNSVSYSWAWVCTKGGLDLTTPGVLLSAINKPTIALAAESLVAGQSYTFRVSATKTNSLLGLTGSSEVSFIVNTPPSLGSCGVSPSSGVALVDMFVMTCALWEDEDLPLRYKFQYKLNTQAFQDLCSVQSVSSYSTLLPLPPSGQDILQIQAIISDTFGAEAAFSFNATVRKQAHFDAESTLNVISERLGQKDVSSFATLVSGAASLLKSDQSTTSSSAKETRATLVTSIKSLTEVVEGEADVNSAVSTPLVLVSLATDFNDPKELTEDTRATAAELILNLTRSPLNNFSPTIVAASLSGLGNLIRSSEATHSETGSQGAEQTQFSTAVTESITALGSGMVTEAVEGEEPREVGIGGITIAAQALSTSTVAGSTLSSSTGSSIEVPASLELSGSGPVQLSLATVSSELYPSDRNQSSKTVLVTISQAGQVVQDNTAETPYKISIPSTVLGVDASQNPSDLFSCGFWNELNKTWDGRGLKVISVVNGTIGDGGSVVCASPHLTAFSSNTEFKISINTFDEDDINADAFSLSKNPIMLFGTLTLVGLALLLGVSVWLDRNRFKSAKATDTKHFWLLSNQMYNLRFKSRTFGRCFRRMKWSIRQKHPWLSIVLHHKGDHLISTKRTIVLSVLLFNCMGVLVLLMGQEQSLPFLSGAAAAAVVSAMFSFPVPFIVVTFFNRHMPSVLRIKPDTLRPHSVGILAKASNMIMDSLLGDIEFQEEEEEKEEEEEENEKRKSKSQHGPDLPWERNSSHQGIKGTIELTERAPNNEVEVEPKSRGTSKGGISDIERKIMQTRALQSVAEKRRDSSTLSSTFGDLDVEVESQSVVLGTKDSKSTRRPRSAKSKVGAKFDHILPDIGETRPGMIIGENSTEITARNLQVYDMSGSLVDLSAHQVNAQKPGQDDGKEGGSKNGCCSSGSDPNLSASDLTVGDIIAIFFSIIFVCGCWFIIVVLSAKLSAEGERAWLPETLTTFAIDFVSRVFVIVIIETIFFAPFCTEDITKEVEIKVAEDYVWLDKVDEIEVDRSLRVISMTRAAARKGIPMGCKVDAVNSKVVTTKKRFLELVTAAIESQKSGCELTILVPSAQSQVFTVKVSVTNPGLQIDETMHVSSIEEGGDAEKKGVQVGWKLVKIGHSVVQTFEKLQALLHHVKREKKQVKMMFRKVDQKRHAQAREKHNRNQSSCYSFSEMNQSISTSFKAPLASSQKMNKSLSKFTTPRSHRTIPSTIVELPAIEQVGVNTSNLASSQSHTSASRESDGKFTDADSNLGSSGELKSVGMFRSSNNSFHSRTISEQTGDRVDISTERRSRNVDPSSRHRESSPARRRRRRERGAREASPQTSRNRSRTNSRNNSEEYDHRSQTINAANIFGYSNARL